MELPASGPIVADGWPAVVSRRPAAAGDIVIRAGLPADAPQIHALIEAHLEAGHLLPRRRDELMARAPHFLVAVPAESDRVVGCAELAPLSPRLAEVRSLVVAEGQRGMGLGGRVIAELTRRARRDSFETLCAFTHQPAHFVRLGFSIVPHVWLPEKIAADCHRCPLFRRCGQVAVTLALGQAGAVS
jgi:amino-acid N-acetyltransferase